MIETGVLLVRKKKPEWQAGRLNGIGGHVEEGETLAGAMLREGREETGREFHWEHFATLAGPHHSGDGMYEMGCFRAFAYAEVLMDLCGKLTDADEELTVVGVSDAIRRLDKIDNLSWLIGMGSGHDQHNWPYSVLEPIRGSPMKAEQDPEEKVIRIVEKLCPLYTVEAKMFALFMYRHMERTPEDAAEWATLLVQRAHELSSPKEGC